jgi:hypothetical protein
MRTIGIPFLALFWNFSGGAAFAHHGALSKDAGQISSAFAPRNLKETEPQKACKDALKEIDRNNPDVACACDDLNENTTVITCFDSCSYCNGDVSVCGSPAFEESFDIVGAKDSVSEIFMYNKGRSESVTIANTECEMDEFGTLLCDGCQVIVDGEQCDFCNLTICDHGSNAGFQLPHFDCSNVEADAVYDVCDGNLTIPDGSVFGFLTTEDEFDVCFPETDMPTLAPSKSPTMAPSSIPSDMPSLVPSGMPSTSFPSMSAPPSSIPSDWPSLSPSVSPGPTNVPTATITAVPTGESTPEPTPESSTSAEPTPEGTDGDRELPSSSPLRYKITMTTVFGALVSLVLAL